MRGLWLEHLALQTLAPRKSTSVQTLRDDPLQEDILALYGAYLREAFFTVPAPFCSRQIPTDPMLALVDGFAALERGDLEPAGLARGLLPLAQAPAAVWLMESIVLRDTDLAEQWLERYRASPGARMFSMLCAAALDEGEAGDDVLRFVLRILEEAPLAGIEQLDMPLWRMFSNHPRRMAAAAPVLGLHAQRLRELFCGLHSPRERQTLAATYAALGDNKGAERIRSWLECAEESLPWEGGRFEDEHPLDDASSVHDVERTE